MVAGVGMVAGMAAAAVFAAGGGTAGVYGVRSEGQFSPPNAFVPSSAVTYDMGVVPAGARIEVTQRGGYGRMEVSVHVDGLAHGRAYRAWVSRGECGGGPGANPGHYQHRQDPVQPSVDPAYANPENEVRLDFTTDASGAGAATARHAWEFRPGEARSVVLDSAPGGVGARVACFTVPFESPGRGAGEG
ncbi:superoxide dismutase family protein [Streptomyces sp. NPDC046821]|uniref:superoxide dismutase family protein n=1 Tax=Streptomyces sp. NPDC046821 TaxID=3154702 RepID=UPI0034100D1F